MMEIPTSSRSILIAEDDPVSRKMLSHTLMKAGYHIVETTNGSDAWAILQSEDSPPLAILDWMMPEMNGPELCQALRAQTPARSTYLMLLTSKGKREDIVKGLEAGADDYIIKPFDTAELRARVSVGFRVLTLQEHLAARVKELEEAIAQIKQLHGLLPICCYCKKIRDDGNYWKQVEEYISENSDVKFSHGICPKCYETELVPQLEALRAEKNN